MNTELQREITAKALIPWKLPCSITDTKKWENSFKHEINAYLSSIHYAGSLKGCLSTLQICPTRRSYEKDPTGSLISSFTSTSKWNSPSLPATCSAVWGSSWNLKTQRNSSHNRILPCNVHYSPANFSLPKVTLWWCTRLNFIKATAVLGSKPKSQFYCKSKLADRILKPFHEDAASEQTFFFFNILLEVTRKPHGSVPAPMKTVKKIYMFFSVSYNDVRASLTSRELKL